MKGHFLAKVSRPQFAEGENQQRDGKQHFTEVTSVRTPQHQTEDLLLSNQRKPPVGRAEIAIEPGSQLCSLAY